VLHVIPAVAARYGGPSTAIVGMCDALNRLDGITAEVATTDSDGPDQYKAQTWPANNTMLHLFPACYSGRRKCSIELNRWLANKIHHYDIIHTHTAWSFLIADVCRAARQHSKPVVYRPCGMLSPYSWAKNRALKYAYWLARERWNVVTAAAIHCTSVGEADEVRAHRVARGRVCVIPLGLDPEAWSTSRDAEALRGLCGPAAGDRPILLFLSRLHPKKGIVDFLLPAFARVNKPAFLAIAGGADESTPDYRGAVESAIDRMGLQGRVAVLGSVASAERWRLFDGAAAFVLPSHQENFGLVVTEAMARGCPVIISDRVQAGDHVIAAKAGSVVPLSIDAFAEAMDALLANASSRAEMGQSSREYARTELGWHRIAKQVYEMYRDCLRHANS
jgi:glycosyltransferase involved in cell wall biosynthesis